MFCNCFPSKKDKDKKDESESQLIPSNPNKSIDNNEWNNARCVLYYLIPKDIVTHIFRTITQVDDLARFASSCKRLWTCFKLIETELWKNCCTYLVNEGS